jgi:RNA polymerase sigma-70 factor (ECF subfamily)
MERKSASEQAAANAALEAALKEHWERVYRVLFGLVGDRFEAEDLALETFWQMHTTSPDLNDNLGGWLYRVATNLGLNALRAQRRRQSYEGQAGSQVLEQQAPANPADEAEKRIDREQVRAVLGTMKDRDVQLLVLRHSGFAYAEIAAVLEIAQGSVGTLLSRAETEFGRRFRALERGE